MRQPSDKSSLAMQISTISMVVAAIVEVVRLGEVRRMDLYTSSAPVPMSVFWLVPQYFIIGAAEIMVNIGTLEMFYSEVGSVHLQSPVLPRVPLWPMLPENCRHNARV